MAPAHANRRGCLLIAGALSVAVSNASAQDIADVIRQVYQDRMTSGSGRGTGQTPGSPGAAPGGPGAGPGSSPGPGPPP